MGGPAGPAGAGELLVAGGPLTPWPALLVPRTRPFAARAELALTEAAGESWIRSGDPRDQHQLLLSACAAAGFTPRAAHSAADRAAVAALVAHGFGLSLVPRLAPIPYGLPPARAPLAGRPAPVRRIVACVRRGAEDQPPVSRGLAALQETAAAGPVPQEPTRPERPYGQCRACSSRAMRPCSPDAQQPRSRAQSTVS